MANNVYIGMRYVPIFLGDWDSSISYEALSIVNYGNNTYTSKKPVPVGTLPTDTNYWALTGNYNGAILNLQGRMDLAENDIDNLEIQRDYIKKTFGVKAGDKICVIGDSLGALTVPYLQPVYTTYLKTWFEELGCTFDNFCTSSRAWASGQPGTSGGVMDAVAGITDSYDVIIVELGVNDWQVQSPYADLYAALNSFDNWRVINQPNAQIYCVLPLSTDTDYPQRVPMAYYSTVIAYQAVRWRWNIIDMFSSSPMYSGMNSGLVNRWTYNGDAIHPNPAYAPIYAKYVYDAVINNKSAYNPLVIAGYETTGIQLIDHVYWKGDGSVRLTCWSGNLDITNFAANLGQLPQFARPHCRICATVHPDTGGDFTLVIRDDGTIYALAPTQTASYTGVRFEVEYQTISCVIANSP